MVSLLWVSEFQTKGIQFPESKHGFSPGDSPLALSPSSPLPLGWRSSVPAAAPCCLLRQGRAAGKLGGGGWRGSWGSWVLLSQNLVFMVLPCPPTACPGGREGARCLSWVLPYIRKKCKSRTRVNARTSTGASPALPVRSAWVRHPCRQGTQTPSSSEKCGGELGLLFFALTFFSFIQHLHTHRSSRRARLALAPFLSKEELKSILLSCTCSCTSAELRLSCGGREGSSWPRLAGHGPFFTYKVF